MIAITRNDKVIVGDVEYEDLKREEDIQRLRVGAFVIWFTVDYEIEKLGEVHLVYYGDEGLEYIVSPDFVIDLGGALKSASVYALESVVSGKRVIVLS